MVRRWGLGRVALFGLALIAVATLAAGMGLMAFLNSAWPTQELEVDESRVRVVNDQLGDIRTTIDDLGVVSGEAGEATQVISECEVNDFDLFEPRLVRRWVVDPAPARAVEDELARQLTALGWLQTNPPFGVNGPEFEIELSGVRYRAEVEYFAPLRDGTQAVLFLIVHVIGEPPCRLT